MLNPHGVSLPYTHLTLFNFCHYYNRHEVKNYPIEVLMYSAKHGHSSLADTAAGMTLNLSTTEFIRRAEKYKFNQDIILQWVCFL